MSSMRMAMLPSGAARWRDGCSWHSRAPPAPQLTIPRMRPRRQGIAAEALAADEEAAGVYAAAADNRTTYGRVLKAIKTSSWHVEQEVFGSSALPLSAEHVRQARTWREMRDVLASARNVPGLLDASFVATALAALPKLLRKARGGMNDADRADICATLDPLLAPVLLPGLPTVAPDALVGAAVGLAKLGHSDVAVYQRVAAAVVPHMREGRVPGKSLASLAWALATACARPSGVFWTVFWTELEARIDELSAQDIANVFWSICRLELMPPWVAGAMPGLLPTALGRVAAAPSGQDAATVMVCLAIWHRAFSYHLAEAELARFCAALQPHLGGYLPQDLVSIVHSLVVMSASPSRAWMTSFYLVLRDRLICDPTLSYADFQRLLWALSRIDYVPSQAWLKHFVEVSVVKLQHLRFRALSELSWALACWGYTPTRDWLAEFFRVTQPQLAQARPPHLANCLTALKKLGCKVPSGWLDAALTSFCAQLPDTRAHDLITFIDGVVDVAEDGAWMSRPATGQRLRALADYAAGKFDICDPVMHAKLLVALATARVVPGASWLSAQQDSLARSLVSEPAGALDVETASHVRAAYAAFQVPLTPTLSQELDSKAH